MQRETKLSGKETAGKPLQDPPSPHKLQSLGNILGLVLSLSDEQWTTLTADVPVAVTKKQFASLCTKILESVTKSVVQRHLWNPSGSATAGDTSGQRSPVDPCDLLCHSIEEFVGKVKMATQKAISRVSSCMESFCSNDTKTTCSRVTQEMFSILKTELACSHPEDTSNLTEEQETPGLDLELPAQTQVDVDSCTDGIVHNIVNLYKKEVIQSASLPLGDHSESALPSDEFLNKAVQVVNDVLVVGASSQEDPSTAGSLSPASVPSAEDVHGAALVIAGTVFGTLDKLVESSAIDCKSNTGSIIKSLEEFRCGSGTSARRSHSVPLYKRVRSYLLALFRTSCAEQTACSTSAVTTTELERIDHLTVTCTDNIIREIVHLCHSESSTEDQDRPGDRGSVEVHHVVQGLEELVRSKDSAGEDTALDGTWSQFSVQSLFTKQFESKAAQTVSEILQRTVEELCPSRSTQSVESFSCPSIQTSAAASSISDQAQCTASEMIRSFLKSLRKCCLSVPSEDACSRPTSSRKKCVPSASHSIYRGAHKKVFKLLLRLQTALSERSKTSTNIKEQDSVNGTSISPPLHPIRRIQVNVDSCMDEIFLKIVELYKSELLLLSSSKVSPHGSTPLPEQSSFNLKTAKSKDFLTKAVKLVTDVLVKEVSSQLLVDSCRRASSSSALSTTSTDVQTAAVAIAETVVDAVDKYVHSHHSATPTVSNSWDTISFLDVLSQTSVSRIPETSEGMEYSSPFLVFRRVKDLLNHHLMGAGRQMMDDGEMPGTNGASKGQNGFPETYTSSSGPGNTKRSVDPDPSTEKKRGPGFFFLSIRWKKFNKVHPAGVVSDDPQPASSSGPLQESSQTDSGSPFKTSRKRLSRIFSDVHRALPNPFKCMTGPP